MSFQILVKNENEPVIALWEPPLYDITYANGRTGASNGPVTSVKKLIRSAGNVPMAKLLDIAYFGGLFSKIYHSVMLYSPENSISIPH